MSIFVANKHIFKKATDRDCIDEASSAILWMTDIPALVYAIKVYH